MDDTPEVIELEISPIEPDTVASVRAELVPVIEEALRQSSRSDMLSSGQIKVEIERPFPADPVTVVVLTFVSGIALETYKQWILPELKRRFKVRQKSKRKKTSKRKS